MQQNAVRLMTVHGAKGLQFPVVFIPDLCDGAFPNLYFKPNMAEERRLLFVGITRTQEVLHCSWTDAGPFGYPSSASPFVDELLVLQRRFKEGCAGRHEVRRGAWHGSTWPVRYYPASLPATAATQPARTVPWAAIPAPPGRPAAS